MASIIPDYPEVPPDGLPGSLRKIVAIFLATAWLGTNLYGETSVTCNKGSKALIKFLFIYLFIGP